MRLISWDQIILEDDFEDNSTKPYLSSRVAYQECDLQSKSARDCTLVSKKRISLNQNEATQNAYRAYLPLKVE